MFDGRNMYEPADVEPPDSRITASVAADRSRRDGHGRRRSRRWRLANWKRGSRSRERAAGNSATRWLPRGEESRNALLLHRALEGGRCAARSPSPAVGDADSEPPRRITEAGIRYRDSRMAYALYRTRISIPRPAFHLRQFPRDQLLGLGFTARQAGGRRPKRETPNRQAKGAKPAPAS